MYTVLVNHNQYIAMTQGQINEIVRKHALWLEHLDDSNKADLSCTDLRGANLANVDLRGADLSCSNLRGANLTNIDLRGADLNSANLCGADLCGANLTGTDLRFAKLEGAKMYKQEADNASLTQKQRNEIVICNKTNKYKIRYVEYEGLWSPS